MAVAFRSYSLLSIGFTVLVVLLVSAVWVAGGSADGPVVQRPLGQEDSFTTGGDLEELFDFDGLLTEVINRPYADSNPVFGPFPRPGGTFPVDDGVPHATVVRATIDGPKWKAFFRPKLNRSPDFCVTPDASPVERESRITVEIWMPDPIDFSDTASAVVLVIKSGLPGTEPTRPQAMAYQLTKRGVTVVVWWERDDNPLDTTPHLDLAVVDRTGESLSLLLGDGTGDFEPPHLQEYPAGTFPHAIVTDDFNGDGILDLAVANDGANQVNVRLGDGFGEFKKIDASDYDVGDFPRAILAVSFNGDAHVDLVVANRNSDSITLLVNDADDPGVFSVSDTVSVGGQPSSVVAADFDGDSFVDLAVANGEDDTITILLGDGNGVFSFSETVSTGVDTNPFAMAVGKFDDNDFFDLVTANRDSDDASLLLNVDGTFEPAVSISLGAVTDPSAVVAADLGGDPNLDLAIANGSGDVTVLHGDGSGGFDLQPLESAGTFPNAIIAADIDADGDLDLVVANRDSFDVTVLLNTGSGFSEAENSPFIVSGDGAGAPIGIAAGNFTDSTWKMAYRFGYSGDGAAQKAGFGWMMNRHLNKAPTEALTNEELRFDFRFVYAQAYLLGTTWLAEFLRDEYVDDYGETTINAWIAAMQISYAGGSKRGGGITTATMDSNIIPSVDPRNVVGLFISGYQGMDAGELSGFHRYETDWKHTFDATEIEELRNVTCPPPTCAPEPCPVVNGCAEDSGEHAFKEFAIWAHRTRHEPHSYANAYTPGQNAANLEKFDDVLVINSIGTHDWINPLGAHRALFKSEEFDLITLQRVNRNHGELIELDDWNASELLQMRALVNFRYPTGTGIEAYPLHRITWKDLAMGEPNWTAEIELDSGSATGSFDEEYVVWVAFSDDRDFRRTSDPIKSRPQTPCIDSDPNDASSTEDEFHEVPSGSISVEKIGKLRKLTFAPPAEFADFTDPLIAVIVEGRFPGPAPDKTLDDLRVTTWVEFLNEDLYKGSISSCQGKDGHNVLTINGDTGDERQHSVTVDSGDPIQFEILKPVASSNGKFVVHMDVGSPTIDTITQLTGQLGKTCFPFLISQGEASKAIWNSIGKENKVGTSNYFGDESGGDPDFAPTTFFSMPSGDPAHLKIGTVFTLQGIITNPEAVGAKKVSITNAIVLHIM